MKTFFRLREFFRENKKYYILGILALIGTNTLQLIIPQLLGRFADMIADRQVEQQGILIFILVLMGLALFIAFFRFLWRMYVMGNARRMEYTLRNMLFRHLQNLSTEFFNRHKTGDLMAHATNDIRAVRMALGPGIVLSIDALFLTSVIIIMMITTIDWRLTVVALLPLPFMAAIVTRFGQLIHSRFKKVQEAFSDLTDRTQENFSGIRVVKGFAQENEEKEKFRQVNQKNVDTNMHLIRVWGFFMPLVQFISALSFIIVLGYGGVLVINGTITLGNFVTFNSYLGMLTWPMMAIGWVFNMIQRGKASMDRLNTLLDNKPDITDEPDAVPLENLQGKIEFRNLSFAYPGSEEPVLKNITFSIAPGQTVGILGRTGSGKTTLMNLLLRLYNPPRGTVFIDGTDIHQIPLETLRNSIGYVPQDNFLFSATIKENVDFASTGRSLKEIEDYTKMAQVYDNIIDFPQKYETLVGERGVTLSGGQKQRISLARALIKDPGILILDDSLSAVDTQTEEAILQNLKQVMADRTSLLIAHRISTLKAADNIIVIEEGEITQEGKHEDLLKEDGLYRQLYQKQLLEEKIDSVS